MAKYITTTRNNACKGKHVVVAELALGKPLPQGAEVHHVNGNGLDNRNKNLVICQDSAYHALLHVRQRAMDASGNPDYRKCRFCRKYDSPSHMRIYLSAYFHVDCLDAFKKEQAVKLKKKRAANPQQKYNFPYHNARVLQVLAEHPDGLNKSELRARAFNRVPRVVSDQWLDVMESKGQIRSQFQPTGKKGRPGLVYRKS